MQLAAMKEQPLSSTFLSLYAHVYVSSLLWILWMVLLQAREHLIRSSQETEETSRMKQLDILDGFRSRALGDVAGGITGARVCLAASGEFLPLPMRPPRMGGASPVPKLSRNLLASLGSSWAMGDAGTLPALRRQPATRVLDIQP